MRPADRLDRRGASPSSLRARRAGLRTKRTILFHPTARVETPLQVAKARRAQRFPSTLNFESPLAFRFLRRKRPSVVVTKSYTSLVRNRRQLTKTEQFVEIFGWYACCRGGLAGELRRVSL